MPGAGQIRNGNGPMLEALALRAGGVVQALGIARDTVPDLRRLIEIGLESNVLILSGGVSAGKLDLVPGVLRDLGVTAHFHKVAMKPGKPVFFGTRDRTLVFGLPGNPVSAYVCFELFVRPALAALQGASHPRPAFARATLASDVDQNPERDELIRVRDAGDGQVEPLSGQSSHQLAITALAEGLARIPAGTGTLARGRQVDYLPLGIS